MRTLTVVPIIHTQQELGRWEKKITSIRQHAYGICETKQFLADIKSYWEKVDRYVTKAYFEKQDTLARLHIFIDSLPITNETICETIIRKSCETKIPAFIIAVALREKGAHIHETENAELLLEEYGYWKGCLERGEPENNEKERRMLQDRDAAIVKRINAIVPHEESALLFIGALHRVADAFRADPTWTIIDP